MIRVHVYMNHTTAIMSTTFYRTQMLVSCLVEQDMHPILFMYYYRSDQKKKKQGDFFSHIHVHFPRHSLSAHRMHCISGERFHRHDTITLCEYRNFMELCMQVHNATHTGTHSIWPVGCRRCLCFKRITWQRK